MRKQKGLSQNKLAKLTGLRQSRISQIESGDRPISEDDWSRLCIHLEGSEPLPARPALPYPDPSWRERPPQLSLQGDVPLDTRINRARKIYGSTIDRCLNVILRRDDSALSLKFLNEACLDSADETTLWLLCLAGAGRACWYALSKAGFRNHRVMDAAWKKTISDVRIPGLEIKRETCMLLLFPQVRLETSRARYRLDALCCVKIARQKCWVNLEVDGTGHDAEFDTQRQTHLGLPTVRFTRSALRRPDFLELMERRSLEALQKMGPS